MFITITGSIITTFVRVCGVLEEKKLRSYNMISKKENMYRKMAGTIIFTDVASSIRLWRIRLDKGFFGAEINKKKGSTKKFI